MKKISKFEKVSYEQFEKDYLDCFPEFKNKTEMVKDIYDRITTPRRATVGSAGYDFLSTATFKLAPKETIKIPTGIKCRMNENWVLQLFPRSGLGFKYRLQLNNTVGIVDSDYINSDNEGHIFIKLTNDSNENNSILINEREAFAQGIFMEYGITEDDETFGIRNGGLGSTTKE